MPLANTFQIPQDLGEVLTPAPLDMCKMAGSTQALADLGLLSAEEMEKSAWVGAAVGAAGKALPWLWKGIKGIGGLFRSGAAGEAASAAAKPAGLWAQTGGRVTGALSRPLGNFGNNVTQQLGSRLGASPAMISKVQGLGKGVASEGLGFGLIGGGLNAAMAEPGQRGEAFARGFGSGMLGGMAWRGAGNVASAGLKRGLGAAGVNVGKLQATADKRWLLGKGLSAGERLRGVGASALLGGVPFAAGMAASSYTPSFEGHAQPQSPYQQYAQPVARLGANIGSQVMGAYPGGYGYNPNLPLPQGGY